MKTSKEHGSFNRLSFKTLHRVNQMFFIVKKTVLPLFSLLDTLGYRASVFWG
jgi:hypothetical protein